MSKLKKAYLISIIITLILLYNLTFGQDTSSYNLATIQVLVTDFENNSKKGEQIIFEGINTGLTYKGVSNELGKFEIQIKGDETYLIKIKGIGDAKDYNKFTIPKLNQGEVYAPSQLTIQFEPSKTFTLDNAQFESGKSTLTQSSFSELEELLEFMKLKGEIIIEIAGHTDNIGEKESNLRLSEARAESVRNYLISGGISPKRVISKGYGENQPIDTNNTPEGRKKNRRTEVRILQGE